MDIGPADSRGPNTDKHPVVADFRFRHIGGGESWIGMVFHYCTQGSSPYRGCMYLFEIDIDAGIQYFQSALDGRESLY